MCSLNNNKTLYFTSSESVEFSNIKKLQITDGIHTNPVIYLFYTKCVYNSSVLEYLKKGKAHKKKY